MNIIEEIQNELAGHPNNVTRSKTKADSLKAMTIGVYNQMVQTFNEGSYMFWASQDASPQEIADSLGTSASGIFYLHARLGEVLSLVDPSGIAEGLSVIGQYAQNQDGSITVIPPSGE
jgi:hypothetical protein